MHRCVAIINKKREYLANRCLAMENLKDQSTTMEEPERNVSLALIWREHRNQHGGSRRVERGSREVRERAEVLRYSSEAHSVWIQTDQEK